MHALRLRALRLSALHFVCVVRSVLSTSVLCFAMDRCGKLPARAMAAGVLVHCSLWQATGVRVVAAGVLVHCSLWQATGARYGGRCVGALLVVASYRRALWRPVCWCIARCGKLLVRVGHGVLVHCSSWQATGARCCGRCVSALLFVASYRCALWQPVCWCIALCGKLPSRVVAVGLCCVALCGKQSRGAL